jgi:hypothetical protein
MKIGIAHPQALLGPDHVVPQQKNEAEPTGQPRQHLDFGSTHFTSARNYTELRRLSLPDRQFNAYGHTFGMGAQDNADSRLRVRNGHAELIRMLGNGQESSHARQVHEQRFDQLGEAATTGNLIHDALERVWNRGRVTTQAITSSLQGWALSGAMPEVAVDLKVRVGGEGGRQLSMARVIPEFGNWNPMAAFIGGLAVKKGFNLVHDFVQPEYATGIGARRNDLGVLAEKFRVNAEQASQLRAGSAGAGIVQAYGEDGRDHLEDAMNETDRSGYDYMMAMQRQTRWAMEPDRHLADTGAASAAIQASLARFAEADFLTRFAGRGKEARPVVYYWQPPELPEGAHVSAATDPLTGSPPANARARRDVPEADRPQRWDYRPDQGVLLTEVGKTLAQIPSMAGRLLVRKDCALAKAGNQDAWVRLGERLEEGLLGVGRGAASRRLAEQLYDSPARQGNKQAQYRLGLMHAEGQASVPAGPRSDSLAVEWLQKAAEQGHPEAAARLGLMHAENRTGLKDEHLSGSQACFWLRKAIEGGVRSPEAMFTLGLMHEKRRGDVGRDEEPNQSAERWYREADKLGHGEASLRLGLLHYKRTPGLRGGAGNDADAARYLGKARDQGNAEAAYCLGLMYRDRRAAPQGEALRAEAMLACLEQAASGGHLQAHVVLGQLLAAGELEPRNGEPAGQAAARWLLQAARQGNADAQCGVADLYRDRKARPEGGPSGDAAAVHWYEQAAAQGSERAWLALAGMHEAGRAGIEPGPEANRKMAECLAKGADQGDRELQFKLAEHYRKGTPGLEAGGEGNAQAARWYARAAALGHVEAKYRLGQFYRDGLAQPQGAGPKSTTAMNEAARLLEEAALDGGHVRAGFELGEMLLDGLVGSPGAAADAQHALRLMEPAAAQGDPDLQYRLAMRHLQRGPDTPQGKRERDGAAVAWLQKAARQGHLPALRQLAGLHIDNRTGCESKEAADRAAMKCIQRAIDLGDKLSQAHLGWMYETGRAGIADLHESQCKAVAHYTELVEGDDPPTLAVCRLAIMGIEGRGGLEKGAVDHRAAQLLERAAELDDGYAMYVLGRLHAQGSCGLDKDVAPDGKAAHWLSRAAEKNVQQAKACLEALRAGKDLGA